MYRPIENEIFHVHTRRCKHASNDSDKSYVEKAIALGAKRIVFTDHCPFPRNMFGNRMGEEELDEYISTLQQMKERYKKQIEIMIGLEVEWLPSFEDWIKMLRNRTDIDLLVLGQHMYEHDGIYSFSDADKSNEYIGLCAAMADGARRGYFDVIAHPDRAFRRCKEWTIDMERVAQEVIEAARTYQLFLEKNYSSIQQKRQYWEPFWRSVDLENQLYGYDAHSVKEMEERYWAFRNLRN